MKTRMIKIGMIIGVLLFICVTTSWADGRIYHHLPKKIANIAKLSKIAHDHHHRALHHSHQHLKYFHVKRPVLTVVRHHIVHHYHHCHHRHKPCPYHH